VRRGGREGPAARAYRSEGGRAVSRERKAKSRGGRGARRLVGLVLVVRDLLGGGGLGLAALGRGRVRLLVLSLLALVALLVPGRCEDEERQQVSGRDDGGQSWLDALDGGLVVGLRGKEERKRGSVDRTACI
jgi:hypothetical protein